MGRPPMPIAQLTRRLPEMGRIKIGVIAEGTTKDGKKYTRPKAIDTFRFTSQDPTALAQVQAELGGEVKPYKHDKSTDTHELITERNEVRIALPPDPLGGSPTYEEYSAGGRESCDGVTREKWRKGPDGPEPYEAPCSCAKAGELSCKVTTHLNLLLPMTRLSGTWRIMTHSYNAALELPGMVDLIRSLQERGLTRGILRIRDEVQVLGGVTRRFKVPTLGVDETAEALAAGAGAMGALPSVPVAITPPAALQIEAGAGNAAEPPPAGVPSRTSDAVAPGPARPEPERVTPEVVTPESSGGERQAPPPVQPPPDVQSEPGGEGAPDGESAGTAVRAAGATPTASGPVTLGDLLNRMEGKTAATRKGRLLRVAAEVAREHSWKAPETIEDIDQRLLDAIADGLPADDPRTNQRKWMHATWGLNGGNEKRKDAISVLTSGATDSSGDLTDEQWREFMDVTGALPVQLPPREQEVA